MAYAAGIDQKDVDDTQKDTNPLLAAGSQSSRVNGVGMRSASMRDVFNPYVFHLTPSEDELHNLDNGARGIFTKFLSWFDFKYTWIIAIIYDINYAYSMGLLPLPNQMFYAGYIGGPLLLIWGAILNYITFVYVSNLVLRGESIVKFALINGITKEEIENDNPINLSNRLIENNITNIDILNDINNLNFNRNEFEVNKLIGIFCGKKYRLLYQFSIIFALFTFLWYFTVVFGVSMARFIGISTISDACNMDDVSQSNFTNSNGSCRSIYTLYICLFYIWCVIMVLLNFKQQIFVQNIIFAFQTIVVYFIIPITAIGLIYGNLDYDSDSGKYYEMTNYGGSGTAHYASDNKAWKWNGLAYMLVLSFWSFNQCFSVPDLIQPLPKEDKSNVLVHRRIFKYGTLILLFIYLVNGIIIALYYGSDSTIPCTIAWEYYIGFFWYDDAYTNRTIGSYIISYLIVLLPCFCTLTAHPLNAISLSNIIEESIFNDKQLKNIKNLIIVRISVVTLSTILSLFIWSFDIILAFSGIGVVVACFLLPTFAEYKSHEMIEKMFYGNNNNNNNSGNNQSNVNNNDNNNNNRVFEMNKENMPSYHWSSQKFWIYAIYVSGVLAAVYTIIEIIIEYS